MKNDFNEKLGIYIRLRRERFNLTQGDVAKTLGVDRSTYAHYEIGDRVMSANMLYKISQLLKFEVNAFYDYYELSGKEK